MLRMTRRQFGEAALVLCVAMRRLWAAPSIDDVLREGIRARKIPAVVGMVASTDKALYSGAFGERDSSSGMPVTTDSIFFIASMTKAITSVAAMQLVERGKVKLDEPVAKHLPQLARLDVLSGFDPSTGKPVLRPATRPVTLRQLMSHTSGFVYDIWEETMFRYTSQNPTPPADQNGPVTPLAFEPGTRWQYGTGVDWTGRLVERLSGWTLEEYFQRNIFQPLGMIDTSFIMPAAKFDRMVSNYHRQADGVLKDDERTLPVPPKFYNGGGGLNSTAGDYVRFMQMILRKGRGPDGRRILREQSVKEMAANQTGNARAGVMKSFRPGVSADVDLHPGAIDRYGLGFLINTESYNGGRSAGSLAWAGIANTFFWIDPKHNLCATLMMQYFPFADKEAVGLLGDFERAVYAAFSRA